MHSLVPRLLRLVLARVGKELIWQCIGGGAGFSNTLQGRWRIGLRGPIVVCGRSVDRAKTACASKGALGLEHSQAIRRPISGLQQKKGARQLLSIFSDGHA